MKADGVIYLVTNKINDKVYVGKTTKTLEFRKRHHINDTNRGSDCAFHRAIRKYGVDSFSWKILEACPKDTLSDREMFYIEKYNSFGKRGYNMTLGGEGNNGGVFTKERLDRMREIGIELWKRPGHKDYMSRLMSKRNRENPKHNELLKIARDNYIVKRRGERLSEDIRKRMSKSEIFNFEHSDGRKFSGTLYEWRLSCGLVNGPKSTEGYGIKRNKSYKGWKINR